MKIFSTDRGVRERICYRWPRGCNMIVLVVVCLLSPVTGQSQPVPIRVPSGFQVTRFADDDLASNIYSMTMNADGEIVVSGPRYVRVLRDRDQDGHADHYHTFAEGPRTGAQGMYFDGHDLVFSGDQGVMRFRDQDRDGQADGRF